MTRRGRRLSPIAAALAVVGVAAGLSLYALSDSIVFFYSPTEVAAKALAPGARLRIGGMVKTGSLVKSGDQNVAFVLTSRGATSAAVAGTPRLCAAKPRSPINDLGSSASNKATREFFLRLRSVNEKCELMMGPTNSRLVGLVKIRLSTPLRTTH